MKPRISFEFFPPKTDEGLEKLINVQQKLLKKNPEFFSVTYGAGGSTRDRTWTTVMKVREAGIDTAPHLSCVGQSREELVERDSHVDAAHFNLGRLAEEQKDTARALDEYGQVGPGNDFLPAQLRQFGFAR